jgi:hypothetical protein
MNYQGAIIEDFWLYLTMIFPLILASAGIELITWLNAHLMFKD